MIKLVFLAILLSLILIFLWGSNKTTTPIEQSSLRESLRFPLQEVSSKDEENLVRKSWIATYTSKGKIAKFRLELVLPQEKLGKERDFRFTKGTFYRELESDGKVLLEDLMEVLQAKQLPQNVIKVDSLPFSAAVLGNNLSELTGTPEGKDVVAGLFTTEPKGNWITTKVFIGEDEAEFFLSIDVVNNIGEIALKDEVYGDAVIAELAKVF